MLLITRPSGWGKSINISMLRYFLNKEVDKNGNQIIPQTYRNIFFGGQYMIGEGDKQKLINLNPLNISKYLDFTNRFNARSMQGKTPVIYLDFSNI